MKVPLRSFFARALFFLGFMLTCANLLLLTFSESIREQVGTGVLIAFSAAGLVVVVSAIFFDRFRRGTSRTDPSQPSEHLPP